MVAVLSADEDEIVYVDYNSPDDFPTLPEAIKDTLTPEARSRVRVVRVRPIHHESVRSKTHLPVVEAVARNVGVRYSNPANRWILSTNTDMIFHPISKGSLTEIVGELDDRYYGIPRFEIPEGLWEELDRYRPVMSIRKVAEWARQFNLREIVLGMKEILFDAPGDFQLIPREALIRIHGFNEQMLKGWHVDSNLCKRMGLLYGGLGNLGAMVEGYHCSHSRVMTLNHRPVKVEDSFSKHVHEVTSPYLLEQAETWGLKGITHEQIRLVDNQRGLVSILAGMELESPEAVREVSYVDETYDQVGYDPLHLIPFIADLLAHQDKSIAIAWIGRHQGMFDLFMRVRVAVGHVGPVLLCREDASSLEATAHSPVEILLLSSIEEKWGIMFFDFIGEDGAALRDGTPLEHHLVRSFQGTINSEQYRMESGHSPRRVVTLNAINNRFENLVRSNLNMVLSPFTTRIRQGYALPRNTEPQDWLEKSLPGVAGERIESGIAALPGERGHVSYGPYASLSKGSYRVEFVLEDPDSSQRLSLIQEDATEKVILDVVSLKGGHLFAKVELKDWGSITGAHELSFEITSEDCDALRSNTIEARVFSSGKSLFIVKSVTLYHGNKHESPHPPSAKSSESNNDAVKLVSDLYRSLLKRNPDQGGLIHYTKVIHESGIEACITGILGSEEFKNLWASQHAS
jgi:hypothetical protein